MGIYAKGLTAAIAALALIVDGCASVPKDEEQHFVSGLLFLQCGEPLASELVTDSGHIFVWVKSATDAATWNDSIDKLIALKGTAGTVQVEADCTRT